MSGRFSYVYTVKMTYLNNVQNLKTKIKPESISSFIINHDYDNNCMPTIFVNLAIDKALADHMILNSNENLISLALYKRNEFTGNNDVDALCFRKKFVYFLSDDINNTDSIDYTKTTVGKNIGETLITIQLGLICVDHINNNRKSLSLATGNMSKKITMKDCIDFCTAHIAAKTNFVMDKLTYNDSFNQVIMPAQNSVNKALAYLNNAKVFYDTPYRFYQDFNTTYLINSSGRGSGPDAKSSTTINSMIFKIKDLLDEDANGEGIIENTKSKTYEVEVNRVFETVYDNTVSNKEASRLFGVTSTGNSLIDLKNASKNTNQYISNNRLNNDNEHMIDNLQFNRNSSRIFVSIIKTGLDSSFINIGRRYTIKHIDSHQDLNGTYLLYLNREIYMRTDKVFTLTSVLNFKFIE